MDSRPSPPYLADLLPNRTDPDRPHTREHMRLEGIARIAGSTFVIWSEASPPPHEE